VGEVASAQGGRLDRHMGAVQRAKSGHLGTPMALAPVVYWFQPKTPEDKEMLFALPPMFSLTIVVNPETTLRERISKYRQLWKEHGGFELRPALWES
jgi:hypothetical protein